MTCDKKKQSRISDIKGDGPFEKTKAVRCDFCCCVEPIERCYAGYRNKPRNRPPVVDILVAVRQQGKNGFRDKTEDKCN